MKDEVEKKFITFDDEKTLERNINELTQKLGILDLREFIAINKFIVDAEHHDDIISRIKTKFLNIALERMDENKAQNVRKLFRVKFYKLID